MGMAAMITIRAELPSDGVIITNIVQRAYAAVSYSDNREHLMIDRLRKTDAYVPALSLIAEIGGEAVGHVLLTRALIWNDAVVATTLALAPLSIVPEFQSQGVGKQLVSSAHGRAAGLGFGSVLVVGIPAYYPQFGYKPLSRYPITLPFEAPDENCMILQLRPGVLDGIAGRVRYAEGWLDH